MLGPVLAGWAGLSLNRIKSGFSGMLYHTLWLSDRSRYLLSSLKRSKSVRLGSMFTSSVLLREGPFLGRYVFRDLTPIIVFGGNLLHQGLTSYLRISNLLFLIQLGLSLFPLLSFVGSYILSWKLQSPFSISWEPLFAHWFSMFFQVL